VTIIAQIRIKLAQLCEIWRDEATKGAREVGARTIMLIDAFGGGHSLLRAKESGAGPSR
jgi:hypothetical protein